MRVLIIEDEIYTFNDLRSMILELYPAAEVDGPVTNLTDMEERMLSQHSYDIIFADIRLEDGICVSVFERIEVTTPVIFTTAYSDFALKAFETNGIAYLLKPVMTADLKKAMGKALALKRGEQNLAAMLSDIGLHPTATNLRYLKAKTYDGSIIISLNDVNHFVLDGNSVCAIMNNGERHRIDYTLDKLMARLDPLMFFRANRQYIISRSAVSRIRYWDNRKLVVKLRVYENVQIIVSKQRASALDKWIEQ